VNAALANRTIIALADSRILFLPRPETAAHSSTQDARHPIALTIHASAIVATARIDITSVELATKAH
jgi:hypothetical protein